MSAITPEMIDALERLRIERRLRLTTHVGLQGYAHLDHDPDALVRELLRLARIGAAVEALDGATPGRAAVHPQPGSVS